MAPHWEIWYTQGFLIGIPHIKTSVLMDYTLNPTISRDERGALRASAKLAAENDYYFLGWPAEHFTNRLLGLTVHY